MHKLKLTRLKSVRQEMGYSTARLASESGVAGSTINRLELGKRLSRWSTAEVLAECLGVSVRDLVDKVPPSDRDTRMRMSEEADDMVEKCKLLPDRDLQHVLRSLVGEYSLRHPYGARVFTREMLLLEEPSRDEAS